MILTIAFKRMLVEKLSIPGPKPLALKPKTLKPRVLGLTLKSYGPPPHPITFKHEGGVPHKNSKSKKGSEWSPLLVQLELELGPIRSSLRDDLSIYSLYYRLT